VIPVNDPQEPFYDLTTVKGGNWLRPIIHLSVPSDTEWLGRGPSAHHQTRKDLDGASEAKRSEGVSDVEPDSVYRTFTPNASSPPHDESRP